MWSRVASVAVALVSLVSVGAARAETREGAPVVPVEIGAGAGATSIYLERPGGTVACGTHCSLELPEGRYRLLVRDADGRESAQWLPVMQPSRVTVTPASRGARVGGIVMMSTGFAASGVGVFFLLAALMVHYSPDCGPGCDWHLDMLYGGAISLAAGVALGVTGIVVWRRNTHARISETSPGAPPGARARLRLAPVAGLRWAGVGLAGSF